MFPVSPNPVTAEVLHLTWPAQDTVRGLFLDILQVLGVMLARVSSASACLKGP